MGYDEVTTYRRFIRTDVEAEMNDKMTSVYIRVPFHVTAEELSDANQMTLRMRYDDGFVAYLWSSAVNLPVEIARANAAGMAQAMPINPLPFDANATQIHSDGQAIQLLDFDVNRRSTAAARGTECARSAGDERLTRQQ